MITENELKIANLFDHLANVVNHHNLQDGDLFILIHLLKCSSSIKSIAIKLGADEDKVSANIKRLLRVGAITKYNTDLQGNTTYELTTKGKRVVKDLIKSISPTKP